MKVYLALSLLLPSTHGYIFASAVYENICGRVLSGGWGPGRVEYRTVSAMCWDDTIIDLLCKRTMPNPIPGHYDAAHWVCVEGLSCSPHDPQYMIWPDAGCIRLQSPSGVKGNGDYDNYACSAGILIGNDPIYVLSSISTYNIAYSKKLMGCSIVKSGTKDAIYEKHPCPQTSTFLKLAAKTTYQACVTTAVALAYKTVEFKWNLKPPGKLRPGKVHPRDLGQPSKPFSEMFRIVGGGINGTANHPVQIVIGNEESGDEEVAYEEIGHKETGHEEVGHEEVGHEEIGHEEVGHKVVGN
ncbi:RNA polymerase II subunit A C-terminal domain phosphatase [Venturia inaequalis]|nr:RNA polymerase II subunit A C-terminal domain phosphatase [Venturia inaequalis]